MNKVITIILFILFSMGIRAQENQYLRELTESVKKLRKAKVEQRNNVIADLAVESKPKIALMDDIKGGGAEYKGPEANRFHMNQVFVRVYGKQNHKMESDRDLLSSKEMGINYSGIEKSIKKGGTVRYTINGHLGMQEFVFVPYHPNTKYKVTIYDDWRHPIEKEATDVCSIKYYNVKSEETITIIIELIDNSHESFESFAILNYNPQKR